MQRVLIMSRVGKYPVEILDGVEVNLQGQLLKTKGPKGELSYNVPKKVKITHDNDNKQLSFEPADESKEARSLWGTCRSIASNMVVGVKDGFKIELQLQGVGYRAQAQGKLLTLFLGYSHDIKMAMPETITVETPTPTEIIVSGVDKQLVGQIAAEIRAFRKPEPYKGKGVRRKGEFVRRKEGKKK